ncbi:MULTISPECIES: NAD-dependent epimerase/dehydratase family protein [unclassified Ensifer]|uniref:NAD-dependent epimerase/dehydratase family protein n=1 Tax=unclassified Ensifer TaxID=2633371 RepID=UPI0009F2D335|nr:MULTISPECIES: NAD-dependent epimerase/dehydratase family protein [unclassified Ensifer]
MNLRGLRFLIFGGGGFIGGHVVAQLLQYGAKVRVFDRSPPQIDHPNLEWTIGSVDRIELLQPLTRGVDFAAYLVSGGVPADGAQIESQLRENILLPLELARACDASGVKRFVFASSGGTVYGMDSDVPIRENHPCWPKNAYGISKLACEHYLRLLGNTSDMATISLRISNPYGERQVARGGQGFIAAAMEHVLAGRPLVIWGDGSAVRDFIYVGDVAKAIISACLYQGTEPVMNVGSGAGISLVGVLDEMNRSLGIRPKTLFEPQRKVDVRMNVLDTRLAAELLGWKPAVSLSQGLNITYAWWKTRADPKADPV